VRVVKAVGRLARGFLTFFASAAIRIVRSFVPAVGLQHLVQLFTYQCTSVPVAESRSATHSMLNAAQKHFATLSKYLSMKDTNRPHMASVATVA
jgi:hypothetical protein